MGTIVTNCENAYLYDTLNREERMPGEFKAVYLSQKQVFVGSRLRRTRELFALDCRFSFFDGSGACTIRILKDNPILGTFG